MDVNHGDHGNHEDHDDHDAHAAHNDQDGFGRSESDSHLVSDPIPGIPGVLKVDEDVEEENVKLFMLRNEALVGEPFTKYISDRYGQHYLLQYYVNCCNNFLNASQDTSAAFILLANEPVMLNQNICFFF